MIHEIAIKKKIDKKNLKYRKNIYSALLKTNTVQYTNIYTAEKTYIFFIIHISITKLNSRIGLSTLVPFRKVLRRMKCLNFFLLFSVVILAIQHHVPWHYCICMHIYIFIVFHTNAKNVQGKATIIEDLRHKHLS